MGLFTWNRREPSGRLCEEDEIRRDRERLQENRRRCIDGAEAYFESVQRDVEERLSSFTFKATRTGDWLTMEWTDCGHPHIRTANLAHVKTIEVLPGRPHSLTGGLASVSSCGFDYDDFRSYYNPFGRRSEIVTSMPTSGRDGAIEFHGVPLKITLPHAKVVECYAAIMAHMPAAVRQGEAA